ncbi:hypothetical protein [Gelidibacter maritimus]|uniref:Uncharacterized protein n=1 Tax=Gelidibacter maritimus TaxID=2761487 RepID=A0A7W2M8V7_9FLAO|nr:hypothetical protein [Gelidibacter maritimus]MBA6154742.1 hypothetical protein [Gelidibacter maritimus]
MVTILLNEIGKIKTKRSDGHNIGTGALTGLLFGDDDEGLLSFSATDKALFGLISGGALDAIVGGITALF